MCIGRRPKRAQKETYFGQRIQNAAGLCAGSDGKSDLGPKTDPANLVRAQEIAGDKEATEITAGKHRAAAASAAASAAEMIGASEELKRLDENRDGRIDQLEVQHALRAKGDDPTYAALSHYQKTRGFGPRGETAGKEAKKAGKLFTEEIAEAEKAKLLEKQGSAEDKTDGEVENGGDSAETVLKTDPNVKIVI